MWGGGTQVADEAHLSEQSNAIAVTQHQLGVPADISPLNLSPANVKNFGWFEHRTIPKLPGSFRSRYWSMLICQASQTEPAVLHAVLAIKSVHKAGVLSETRPNTVSPRSTFQLTKDGLQHYVHALGQLRVHTPIGDVRVLRVLLISCTALSALELMRGYVESVKGYITNAMRLMRENGLLTNTNEPSPLVTCVHDSAEQWITKAFSRLYLQRSIYDVIFLNMSNVDLHWPECHDMPPISSIYSHAWTSLDCLVLQSLWLLKTSNTCRSAGTKPQEYALLLERRA